jgi:hypothetical protein
MGHIAVFDGEKYLVAFDGQTAQSWKKAWGMKKASSYYFA